MSPDVHLSSSTSARARDRIAKTYGARGPRQQETCPKLLSFAKQGKISNGDLVQLDVTGVASLVRMSWGDTMAKLR